MYYKIFHVQLVLTRRVSWTRDVVSMTQKRTNRKQTVLKERTYYNITSI